MFLLMSELYKKSNIGIKNKMYKVFLYNLNLFQTSISIGQDAYDIG